jgi:hypothetical protein
MGWFWSSQCGSFVILCAFCELCDPLCTIVDRTLWYTWIQFNWVVSAFNFHIVSRMLITWESGVGAFLHLTLLQIYHCYYILHIIVFCTCWVPTISVLNLAIFPATQTCWLEDEEDFGVLWYGVLASVYHQLIVCGLMVSFCCNASERVRLSLL